MKLKNRIGLSVIILIFTALPISSDGSLNILATNSWTAAFVEAAGGEAVQLAPSDMEHPPEYELIPSDVRNVRGADVLVFAGYEVLMKTVFDSFEKPADQLVKIMTSYSPFVFEQSVLAIAEKIGTLPQAKQNIAAYKMEVAAARVKLEDAGLLGAPVLVQFHQKPLAEALGFEILGVFGPQPLEVRQIADFGKLKPVLIIDNAHSPMASPLEEILGIDAVELVNFPGYPTSDGERVPSTLIGVLIYNTEKLLNR